MVQQEGIEFVWDDMDDAEEDEGKQPGTESGREDMERDEVSTES